MTGSRKRLNQLRKRAKDCDHELFNLGIAFTVYSNRDAIDRAPPFDVVPCRVIKARQPVARRACDHPGAGIARARDGRA
ncbi:MAG: hypothetical protein VW268_09625 [Rhodospirillaceae bacterium]